MPKHTITQEPTDGLIPGASKAWMSHFSPSSNGRIIRVRLNDNNYLAYHPELLCRLTEWHNLHGGACQHGNSDARYTRWPCAGCRGWVTQNSDRALNKALDNPNRKIAMVPGPICGDNSDTRRNWYWPVASKAAYPKSKMGKREGLEEEVARHRPGENFPEEQQTEEPEEKVYKKKRSPPGKKMVGKDLNHLRFAHHNVPGQDDPVENGRDIAFSGDVLPSDSRWQHAVINGSSGVTLGTAEEKELADLRKQGLLKENTGGEGALTLDSIVRDDQPVYTIRLVQKKKKGGKSKRVNSASRLSRENPEQQASETNDIADDKSGDNVPQTLELLSQEAIEAMPEHCWTDFLADMEVEGWVPVVEDDLTSVAESWVVMESGSEDSDEKT